MALTIRDETPDDRAAIRDVVTAAFGQADEADLVDQLRRDGDCLFSLVAIEGNALVGHIALSRMAAPFRALGLAPVSVAPPAQRRGIGSRLIRDGLDRAASAAWDAVFVVGEPTFYRRFGFDAGLARDFASPYAGPHLMVKPLAGTLPATGGRIDYAPAFGRLP
ncbi:MAG TPA: N-acetyltransferase [Vineibacter sp.]|nr:N-acetyltransferase [Vineibacter sp.]